MKEKLPSSYGNTNNEEMECQGPVLGQKTTFYNFRLLINSNISHGMFVF